MLEAERPAAESYNFNRDAVFAYALDDAKIASRRRFTCDACGQDLHATKFEMVGEPLSQPSFQRTAIYARKTCKDCRAPTIRALPKHPLYTKQVSEFFGKVACSMRTGARARSIPCLIDKVDLIEMYVRQNGQCAISGLPLKLEGGSGMRDKRGWLKASVDRIDSRGSYSVSNVHIVAQAVNLMKFDLPMDLFLDLCDRIATRRLAGEI